MRTRAPGAMRLNPFCEMTPLIRMLSASMKTMTERRGEARWCNFVIIRPGIDLEERLALRHQLVGLDIDLRYPAGNIRRHLHDPPHDGIPAGRCEEIEQAEYLEQERDADDRGDGPPGPGP